MLPPGANMLGIDVTRLDVPGFLAAARLLFPLLAVAWLALLIRFRRPAWLLLGVLLANAWVWGVTNYPLQRIYALGPSRDRVGNLAFCTVVAAGNPPQETWMVGQIHFEPFWGLLVAAISGFSIERVFRLYPFLPLAVVTGFALSLYFGLRPLVAEVRGEGASTPAASPDWSGWERALVAGFATLLSSSPLDSVGPFHVPWAMTFLLKPNHALALALFPLFVRAFAKVRGWRGRLGAGLLLHLLAWAFVLHMAYVAAGLVAFAVLALLARRADAGKDVLDAASVFGVNVLIVSPYLVMLVVGYPFLERSPGHTIPASSPHLLETTLRTGWIFPLGAWGAFVAHRRGDRLSRVWAAQILGAFLVWAGYLGVGALGLARERDEIYYWARFLAAASAGVGAWDVTGRIARRASGLLPHPGLGPGARPLSPALMAAAVSFLCLPFSLPYWWYPPRMDPFFSGSLTPLPEMLQAPAEFLRTQTAPDAVLGGDLAFAKWAAALTGRRSVVSEGVNATRDWGHRWDVERVLVTSDDSARALAAAAEYRVGYLVVTPALLRSYPETSLDAIARRPHLRLVHMTRAPGVTNAPRMTKAAEADFVAIFRLE